MFICEYFTYDIKTIFYGYSHLNYFAGNCLKGQVIVKYVSLKIVEGHMVVNIICASKATIILKNICIKCFYRALPSISVILALIRTTARLEPSQQLLGNWLTRWSGELV